MLRTWILLVAVTMTSTLALAGGSPRNKIKPPTVVDSVDIKRYQGKWLEMARLPNPFQKNCYNSSAEYLLQDDDRIQVINRCVESGGKQRQSKGTAWSTNAPANSKLKVRFFWPFTGDYWILALDKDYQWVIVGSPDYRYLWILVRKLPIDGPAFQNLLNIASERGFDTTDLIVDPSIQLR